MDSNQLTPHVIVLWGDEGTWKTTFGLSYPKPLVHIETDVGGYNRAAWRLDTRGVTTTTYIPPLPDDSKKITIKFPDKLVGIKELWQKIFMEYVKACRDPKVKTIVIDSATELWTICHRGYLQEQQETQIAAGVKEHDIKKNISPFEYVDPNARMRQLINAAKSYQKYLVLTHYSKDVYATVQKGEKSESMPTGEITPDGFKDTGKLVDIIVKLDFVKNPKADEAPVEATIVKKCALAGMGTTALGMSLPEPSYQGLVDLRNTLAGE